MGGGTIGSQVFSQGTQMRLLINASFKVYI